MELTKIHRVVKFRQSNFLKKYIDLCTKKRAASKTPFAKRLYKLYVNAVYGKFIEQVRDYVECKICHTQKQTLKWISCPRYTSMKIISKELVIIFLKPPKIVLNKAYAIGFTILELSKYFMFSEFYERIQPSLKTCEVLFSDTDSLALAIFSKTKKVNHLKKMQTFLDFSNYPPDHPNYNNSHANLLGYWKDEMTGEHIMEYVGLRSKCYALKIKTPQKIRLKSTCKGVRKAYKKTIPFETFKKCIKKIHQHSVTQYNIQSHSHIVNTLQMTKIAFNSFDDKRYLMHCGIHSVAYGSRFIAIAEKINKCIICKK